MNKAIRNLMIAGLVVAMILAVFVARSGKPAEAGPEISSAPFAGQDQPAPPVASVSIKAARLRQNNIMNRAREDVSKAPQPATLAVPENSKHMPELVELNTPVTTNGTVAYRTTTKLWTWTFASLTPKPRAQAEVEQSMADLAAAAKASDPDGLARTRYEDYEQKVEKLKKGMPLEAVLEILGEPETKTPTKYGQVWVYSPYSGRTKYMHLDLFPMLRVETGTNGKLQNFYFRQDMTF
ncbi:MAG: hypothetical protein ACO1QS_15025 [Verrucomicrobiota bacterium]